MGQKFIYWTKRDCYFYDFNLVLDKSGQLGMTLILLTKYCRKKVTYFGTSFLEYFFKENTQG